MLVVSLLNNKKYIVDRFLWLGIDKGRVQFCPESKNISRKTRENNLKLNLAMPKSEVNERWNTFFFLSFFYIIFEYSNSTEI